MVRKINKKKRKFDEIDVSKSAENDVKLPPPVRKSDDPPPQQIKWINRQRALVFSARGITQRDRHFIKDLKTLMPHSRDENKMEPREHLSVINEMCIMKNCTKAVFFESRKKKDLYMWISHIPEGPSAKFLIENVFTMAELKLTGNCLKGTRPILSFDEKFKSLPHYSLLKELFIQTFGVPHYYPKSQPFFDKVITFTVMDNRIWYRNYQILKEDGALAEIGPRFVMNPIKIFANSFGGETMWENPHYVTPSAYRRQLAQAAGSKYVQKKMRKEQYEKRLPERSYPDNPGEEVFQEDTYSIVSKLVGEDIPSKLKVPDMAVKKTKRAGKKFKKQKLTD